MITLSRVSIIVDNGSEKSSLGSIVVSLKTMFQSLAKAFANTNVHLHKFVIL